MDYRKKLVVEPGSKVKLKAIDPAFHGKHEDEDGAKAELAKEVARLTELQYRLYAEKKHALLIVLQGIDAAGKDGTVWHVLTAMNPQGTTVTGFKEPTEQRARPRLPLARPRPHARQGPGRGLQPLALRGRARRPRPRPRARRRSGRSATTRSTPSSGSSPTTAPPSSSSSSTSPPRSSSAASRTASTTRRASGRSATATTRSAPSGTTTSRPTRRCSSAARPTTPPGT